MTNFALKGVGHYPLVFHQTVAAKGGYIDTRYCGAKRSISGVVPYTPESVESRFRQFVKEARDPNFDCPDELHNAANLHQFSLELEGPWLKVVMRQKTQVQIDAYWRKKKRGEEQRAAGMFYKRAPRVLSKKD